MWLINNSSLTLRVSFEEEKKLCGLATVQKFWGHLLSALTSILTNFSEIMLEAQQRNRYKCTETSRVVLCKFGEMLVLNESYFHCLIKSERTECDFFLCVCV